MAVNVVCGVIDAAQTGNSRQKIGYALGVLTVDLALIFVAKDNACLTCLGNHDLHAANNLIAVLVKLVLLNKEAEDTHALCAKYLANVECATEELQVRLKIVCDFIFTNGRAEGRNNDSLCIKATLDLCQLLIRFCNYGSEIHRAGLNAKQSVSLESLDLTVNTVVCFVCKSGDQKFCHSSCPFVMIRL